MKDKILILINKVKEISEVSMAISDLNWIRPQFGLFNIVAEFSERNSNLINTIISQFSENYNKEINSDGSFEKVDNRIVLFFIMRDLIENIEIIFYLLLDHSQIIDKDLQIDDIYLDKMKKVFGSEKMKKLSIAGKENNNELEKMLFKKYGKEILPNEFKKIVEIKSECNNYIHKNGIKFINGRLENYYSFMLKYLENLLYVFKFNFKLLFLLEGSILASSDYTDYLDVGMTPPENSQYWIASIFTNYINNQFSIDERKWLIENNTYGMQLPD